MSGKKLGIAVMAGLFIATLIPTYNYFLEDNSLNKNIVFEYSNKKVYESQLIPYVNYYLKMSGNTDLNTKNIAVDNYIRSVLMAEFAEDNGYSISNIEIEEFIKKVPVLNIEGKFSMSKYEEFLKILGIEKYTFEEEVRKDLLILKMMDKIDSFSNINNFYFDIMKDVLSQKRTISKVKVNMDKIFVDYKEEKIKEIYNLNKDKYKKSEKITFYKKTYIHPFNQSEEIEDIDLVKLETNDLYENVKLNIKEDPDILNDFKISTMTLVKEDFYNLIGLSKEDNISPEMSFIDSVNVDNGIITLYNIKEIIEGDNKSFSEVRDDIINSYTIEDKIEKAYLDIVNYEDISKSTGKDSSGYFNSYSTEVINPLENNEKKYLYELAYSMPLNDIKFYYEAESNEYFFIKLEKIEKIELSEEQTDYFRTSQNNIYKQFINISLYDGIKRKYNLIRHKKES